MRAMLLLMAALMGLIQNPGHAQGTTLAEHLERTNRTVGDVIDRTLDKFRRVLDLYAEATQKNDTDAMEVLLTAVNAFQAQMTERCMPLAEQVEVLSEKRAQRAGHLYHCDATCSVHYGIL